MTKIVHIINPVNASKKSDLFITQPIVFKSIQIAKEYSKNTDVSIVTTQYEEDKIIIPNSFIIGENLKRSAIDFGFNKKLPIFKDILDIAYKNSKDGDYIIYTNIDIILKPIFYEFVNDGLSNFSINRRNIDNYNNLTKKINLIFSAPGTIHGGYDCFIFKRELISKLCLGNILIGIPKIGELFHYNLQTLDKNYVNMKKQHVTSHIGNNSQWKTNHSELIEFNLNEFNKEMLQLNKIK